MINESKYDYDPVVTEYLQKYADDQSTNDIDRMIVLESIRLAHERDGVDNLVARVAESLNCNKKDVRCAMRSASKFKLERLRIHQIAENIE